MMNLSKLTVRSRLIAGFSIVEQNAALVEEAAAGGDREEF
jgi:hypothetical protein